MRNTILGLLFIPLMVFAAEKKITELTLLPAASFATGDVFPIVDVSVGETKKTRISDLDLRFIQLPGSVYGAANTVMVSNGSAGTWVSTITGLTLTGATVTGANTNYGTATNSVRLVLPKDTTTNLDALTDVEGLFAFDTTRLKPVFNTGSQWKVVGSGSGSTGQNLLAEHNGNAEDGSLEVNESGGGTLTTITSSDRYWGDRSFSYDASAASDYSYSELIAVGELKNTNCELRGWYKGGDANLTLQVSDGTNTINSQALAAQTNWTPVSINFVCPSSGSLQYRFFAGANAAVIYYDEMHLGSATNIYNYNGAIDYGTETLTDDWANATTTARITRFGDRVLMKGLTTVTGAGASGLNITIPTAYAAASSEYAFASNQGHTVGRNVTFYDNGVGNFTGNVFLSTLTNLQLYYENPAASSMFTGLSSTVPFTWANGDRIHWEATWLVSGWSTMPVAALNSSVPGSWTGYHANDCSFTRANSAYGEFVADASCTFTELQNDNMGTVASTGAKTPGLSWTPRATGKYLVLATFVGGMNTGALAYENYTFGMSLDGSTAVVDQTQQAESGGGAASAIRSQTQFTIYNATSTAAVNLRFIGKTGSGDGMFITGNGVSHSIDWQIIYLGPLISSSMFTNSLATNNATQAYKEIYADLECDGSSQILTQSGTTSTGFATIGNASSGACAVTFASGTFSATPWCTANVIACSGGCVVGFGSRTSGGFTLQCITDTGGGGTSCSAQVKCTGAR